MKKRRKKNREGLTLCTWTYKAKEGKVSRADLMGRIRFQERLLETGNLGGLVT